MRTRIHPLSLARYDVRTDGNLDVTEKGVSGVFDRHGRWVSGELHRADPQLCGWLAGLLGVALAWLLHQPGVTAPIIGPRTVSQLDASMRALEITLTDDVLTRLDEIFPGPGGAPQEGKRRDHRAPEAYAW